LLTRCTCPSGQPLAVTPVGRCASSCLPRLRFFNDLSACRPRIEQFSTSQPLPLQAYNLLKPSQLRQRSRNMLSCGVIPGSKYDSMKASLVLKMGQQLTMTPQLQQAIRLLQLSTLDLQQEIQEALDSNPMLEREEDGEDFDNPDPMAESLDQKIENTHSENSSTDSQYEEPVNTMESFEEGDWGERIPNELPVDTAWEDIYQTSASSLPSNDD